MFAMQDLLTRWEKEFYTEPFLAIILFVSLWIALKNRRKYRILRYIPVYIISFLLAIISIISAYIARSAGYSSEFFFSISDYLDYLFTLVELIIFSHFYYQIINNSFLKKILIFLNLSFIAFFLQMAFSDQNFYRRISNETQAKVYTVEGAILLLICFFYFIELFTKTRTVELKKEPTFWVSTGLLFFLTCTLPYSILETHFPEENFDFISRFYSIFYIFYIVVFLTIIRAYTCKPERVVIVS